MKGLTGLNNCEFINVHVLEPGCSFNQGGYELQFFNKHKNQIFRFKLNVMIIIRFSYKLASISKALA